MPAMGYAVAAAAGMTASLALTTPLLLSSTSPLLRAVDAIGAVDTVVDDDPAPDDPAPGQPGADEGSDQDGTGELRQGAPVSFDSGEVSAFAASSASTGDASFLVVGSGLLPRMEVRLASPGLRVACTCDTVQGLTARTDRNGHVNLLVTATGCVPGRYQISMSEVTSPFRTFTAEATVR